MNKIAIFTLQGLGNYGNKLQNYAVERIMSERSDRVHSLVPTNHVLLKPLQTRIDIFRDLLLGNERKRKEAKRKLLFLKFDKQYLHIKYTQLKKLMHLDRQYDVFITGSDQVWNPSYDPKGIFLLPFTEKRVCISPSIGVGEISEDGKRRFEQELPYFKHLSVREESGKRILEGVTGRKVERLIDPTMYIDVAEWEKIEKRPSGINTDKFIFCYTLGKDKIDKTDIAKQIKAQFACGIYSIYDERHENTIIAGPQEFIWLVHHSSYVLTDSYHAAVFSILFHKEFMIFRRGGGALDMNTRFETLLNVFGIENKTHMDGQPVEYPNINYGHVDHILQEERRKMKDYISICFG